MGDVGRFVGPHTFPCHEYCWYVCLMLTNNYPVNVGKIWLTHNLSTWIYMDGIWSPSCTWTEATCPTDNQRYNLLSTSAKPQKGGRRHLGVSPFINMMYTKKGSYTPKYDVKLLYYIICLYVYIYTYHIHIDRYTELEHAGTPKQVSGGPTSWRNGLGSDLPFPWRQHFFRDIRGTHSTCCFLAWWTLLAYWLSGWLSLIHQGICVPSPCSFCFF